MRLQEIQYDRIQCGLGAEGELNPVNRALVDYFCCPAELAGPDSGLRSSGEAGFFCFEDALCYGSSSDSVFPTVTAAREHQLEKVAFCASCTDVPFDLAEVVDNLRHERYMRGLAPRTKVSGSALVREAYYSIRPILPVSVRSHLQKAHLSGWRDIPFPSWPIDRTVDKLMQAALKLRIETSCTTSIPFIWFWPDEAHSAALVTHDVEHEPGLAFCSELASIDESYGVRSSFQFIPERRYQVTSDLIDELKGRGFEINVHDLYHDGRLFQDRHTFLERAPRIEFYRKQFAAAGFRSGAMYRNLEWLSQLGFLYDMSVPNAAHLEPQQGGCCTIMPFQCGKMYELPLTLTQDYSLFHILKRYSMDLWKAEIDYIVSNYGLINAIVHPDYVIEDRARHVYRELLQYLAELRNSGKVWMALPGDTARWWQLRGRMRLERCDQEWKVVGEGCERASVAYAEVENDQLIYRIGKKRVSACNSVACSFQM